MTTNPVELPSYDVDWVDVVLDTRTKTVKMPYVEVVLEEREVEVPYITATWTDDNNVIADRTIIVDAEVVNRAYDLLIEQIYASNDRIYVLSTLKPESTLLDDVSIRVSDQVIISAPDLTVKHFIIGQKPARAFNDRYDYIDDKSVISDRLQGAKLIYGSS